MSNLMDAIVNPGDRLNKVFELRAYAYDADSDDNITVMDAAGLNLEPDANSEDFVRAAEQVINGFEWSATAQGGQFWCEVYDALMEIAQHIDDSKAED